jgi:hypothetical protein
MLGETLPVAMKYDYAGGTPIVEEAKDGRTPRLAPPDGHVRFPLSFTLEVRAP